MSGQLKIPSEWSKIIRGRVDSSPSTPSKRSSDGTPISKKTQRKHQVQDSPIRNTFPPQSMVDACDSILYAIGKSPPKTRARGDDSVSRRRDDLNLDSILSRYLFLALSPPFFFLSYSY